MSIMDVDDETYRLHQEQSRAVAQLQDDLDGLEATSANVLRRIVERGEATEHLSRTGALVNAARALLVAVDYRCAGADRDVRIRDLWGAAYALKQIEQALGQH